MENSVYNDITCNYVVRFYQNDYTVLCVQTYVYGHMDVCFTHLKLNYKLNVKYLPLIFESSDIFFHFAICFI